MKARRGTYTISTAKPNTSIEADPREEWNDRRLEPVRNTREIVLKGEKFHIGTPLSAKEEEELRDVLT